MSVEKRREIKTKARSLAAESSAMAISSLRTFGELLTTEIGDKEGLSRASNESQQEFLERLHQVAKLPLQVRRDFEHLRVLGNKGIHEYVGTRQDFESAFKAACSLDEWWEMVILNHDSVSSARLEPQQPKRPNRTS